MVMAFDQAELKRLGVAARLIRRGGEIGAKGYLLTLPEREQYVEVDWEERRCGAKDCPCCRSFPRHATSLERRQQSERCEYGQYVAGLIEQARTDKMRELACYQPDIAKFTDDRFQTACQKAKLVTQYVRFASSGFTARRFTDRLYTEFRQHCGFIAHYDKYGFFAEYFTRESGQREFVANLLGEAGINQLLMPSGEVAVEIARWTRAALKAGLLFYAPALLTPPSRRASAPTAQLSLFAA